LNRLPAIKGILLREDYNALVEAAAQHGGRIASALIGLLVDLDEGIKWRAVTALGLVGRRLYLQDPGRLRKVIRQLIWNLNEESGGIGWGMAEAFGEILATVPEVRDEYLSLLVSYLTEEACRPENPDLIKGVIWALGRAKVLEQGPRDQVYPFLLELLKDPDPAIKGLSAWTLGEIRLRKARSALERLQTEDPMIKIYCDGSLEEKPFSQWVNEAIKKIELGGQQDE
jgi:HEAT repeats